MLLGIHCLVLDLPCVAISYLVMWPIVSSLFGTVVDDVILLSIRICGFTTYWSWNRELYAYRVFRMGNPGSPHCFFIDNGLCIDLWGVLLATMWLANPKVIDGNNERFYAIVWGFCDLGVLMLFSGWLCEMSSLIVINSLIFSVKWGGGGVGQNMLCKFFCKHVQQYLIACLLSTALGPSICCTFLHVIIWMISSMQHPHSTLCLLF
jgi:hypothetical protein